MNGIPETVPFDPKGLDRGEIDVEPGETGATSPRPVLRHVDGHAPIERLLGGRNMSHGQAKEAECCTHSAHGQPRGGKGRSRFSGTEPDRNSPRASYGRR